MTERHIVTAKDFADAAGWLNGVQENLKAGYTLCDALYNLEDCSGGNEDSVGYIIAVEMVRHLADLDHAGILWADKIPHRWDTEGLCEIHNQYCIGKAEVR